QVYDMNWFKDYLKCGSRFQCMKTPEFQRIASDLINIFPEYKEIARDHQPLQFGMAENLQPKHAELKCAYKSTFSMAEPPDNAKGDIARIIFYMHTEYGLPMKGDLITLKQWNTLDPPDAAEKTRDAAIQKAQGYGNPFVAHPELADKLEK
ncbi:MAG TPA: endonuclease, partial [Pseudomonadales bacterium]|nr:endonuclease [Pseudomonadales bacterium]